MAHSRLHLTRRRSRLARFVTARALSSAALTAQLSGALAFTAPSIDPVIQWSRNLLAIVRTPGAQPATIHPTRSFAILHAAIHDAVNAIDQTPGEGSAERMQIA